MPQSDPQKHQRRSIRLKDYDYASPGAYFITLCTHERMGLFGQVVDGEMRLNEIGRIVQQEWARSGDIRKEMEMGEFVVMPNHLHGIVWIVEKDNPPANGSGLTAGATDRNIHTHDAGATGRSPLRSNDHSSPRPGPMPRSLGAFIAGFKSACTKRINSTRSTPGQSVWQRNYYERVIRDEDELNNAREYILNNPLKWELDRENPDRIQVNR